MLTVFSKNKIIDFSSNFLVLRNDAQLRKPFISANGVPLIHH